MPSSRRRHEESFWTLHIPKIGVIKFKSTRYGRLGIKTSRVPKPERQKSYVCPTCKKELADTFRGKYCVDCKKYFLESEALIKVRHRSSGREYTWDDFKKMNPRTKEAKVVSIVDSDKVSYALTSSPASYFLQPVNDFENVCKYNQMVMLLKDNNLTAITSPMRLVEGSETQHVYALFADLSRECLIAVQLLKKEGLREVPAEASYTEKVESPTQVATVRKGLYKDKFKF